MVDIKIVHLNCDGDGVTALYLDQKKHTHGDDYHDKIDDWIDGWIAGITYAKVKHEIAHFDVPSKDDDEDDSWMDPPDDFDSEWLKFKRMPR